MALLWKATAIQTNNVIVNAAKTREEAMVIVNKSIDRWGGSFSGPLVGAAA
jgi:hypothetical protein